MPLWIELLLAGIANGLSDAQGRDAAVTCAASYRLKMRDFAATDVLDVWYARIDDSVVLAMLPQKYRAQLQKRIAKATAAGSHELVFPKLAGHAFGRVRIRDMPPTIFHPGPSHPGTWKLSALPFPNIAKPWLRIAVSSSIATGWPTRR